MCEKDKLQNYLISAINSREKDPKSAVAKEVAQILQSLLYVPNFNGKEGFALHKVNPAYIEIFPYLIDDLSDINPENIFRNIGPRMILEQMPHLDYIFDKKRRIAISS